MTTILPANSSAVLNVADLEYDRSLETIQDNSLVREKQFRIMMTSGPQDAKDGYFGALIQDTRTGQVYIAHRGTDSKADLVITDGLFQYNVGLNYRF